MRMGRSEKVEREREDHEDTHKHYYGVGLYPKVSEKFFQNKKQRNVFYKYYSVFNMENALEIIKKLKFTLLI